MLAAIYPILALLLILSNLDACGSRTDPEPLPEPVPVAESEEELVRRAEQTGNAGALKVTLLWDFEGDIDLHVRQPNYVEIYWESKVDSSTGGFLDVDDKSGGRGSAENIYWENPPKGKYLVYLHYYGRSDITGIAQAGTCTVVVFQEGKEEKSYRVRLSSLKEIKNVVEITVN